MLSFAASWMELENIILSKLSQAQKDGVTCSHLCLEAKTLIQKKQNKAKNNRIE
jgi:hypothetical protein